MESKRKQLEASQKRGENQKVPIKEVSPKIKQGNQSLQRLEGGLKRKIESLNLPQRIGIKRMKKINLEIAESLQW